MLLSLLWVLLKVKTSHYLYFLFLGICSFSSYFLLPIFQCSLSPSSSYYFCSKSSFASVIRLQCPWMPSFIYRVPLLLAIHTMSLVPNAHLTTCFRPFSIYHQSLHCDVSMGLPPSEMTSEQFRLGYSNNDRLSSLFLITLTTQHFLQLFPWWLSLRDILHTEGGMLLNTYCLL